MKHKLTSFQQREPYKWKKINRYGNEFSNKKYINQNFYKAKYGKIKIKGFLANK